MASNILTAKQTFEEGLIMDFSPDNTLSNCLTSALNATLLTFNGNEMALLNDMGNGRVETAYLPEGYVPVGTCEFGDIIYVVSYNPLINKSQIGCFPSPERNISSDEIGETLSLSWTDFQESTDKINPKEGTPTGKLKASSIKKILYKRKNMNPGDKYIIYSLDLNTDNTQYLSDYGSKSHLHNSFPKLVKVHVVSIEESGKIVYLDSTTKWYKDNDYYLSPNLKIDSENNEDLDTYRARVNSAYSVFSSKVSGKLALLVELEKISGFSCSWLPYINEIADLNTTYSIYWNFNWTTNDNNINPNGIILTESNWSGIEEEHKGLYLIWILEGEKIRLGKDFNRPEDDDGWRFGPNIPPTYESFITRNYLPENSTTFETFMSKYEYNKYLDTELDRIKKENGETEYEKFTTPYKLNICKTDGLPLLGLYLVNCNNIIDKEYYTTNLDGKLKKIGPILINDDLVNNYFHYPVIKEFTKFTIPTKQIFTINGELIEKAPNISNLIYHYKIAPTMPYGILDEFEQEGYIDFNKIGTKNIELNTWKYHNYENTSTLTWGMDAYTEPGKGISEVVFEFYDNNGFAAAYHNKGKLSYSGTFTEYITLNESGSNYKLNNIPADSNEPKYHKGLEVNKDFIINNPNEIYLDDLNNKVNIDDFKNPNYNYTGKYYQDDSGTLYSNYLYLVKIIIKYSVKGALDEYIDDPDSYITDYRWYWTNPMFNDYYYSTLDFKDLLFTLNLDFNALYQLKPNTTFSLDVKYEVPNNETTELNKNEYTQLKANVTYVNQDGKDDLNGNIECKLLSGLYNDYNMFNLNSATLNNIKTTVYLGKSYIESPDLPSIISSEDLSYVFPGIYPTNDTELDENSGKVNPAEVGPILTSLLGITEGNGEEINASSEAYKNYKNSFSLNFSKNTVNNTTNGTETNKLYINYKGEIVKLDSIKYLSLVKNNSNISIDINSNNSIDFTFTGILYSKYYEFKKNLEISATLVKPLLSNSSDAEKYNMEYNEGHFYFNQLGGVLIGDDADSGLGSSDERTKILYFQGSVSDDYSIRSFENIGGLYTNADDPGNYLRSDMLKTDKGTLNEVFPGITPFMLMRHDNWGKFYRISPGINNTDNLVKISNIHLLYFDFTPDIDCGGIYSDLGHIQQKNSFIFLALKDRENQLHFLNTFIKVGFYEQDDKRITLDIFYKYNVNHELYLPKTIGDAVASVLMNLYYTTGTTTAFEYFGTYNFIHLDNHDYIFTKDIIFKLDEVENTKLINTNDMILLHKMPYLDYINNVINSITNNDELKKLLKDSLNIKLRLLGIEKNCPLLFKFSYVVPLLVTSSITPNYVVKCSDGTEIPTNTSFSSDVLYYLSIEDKKIFNKLGSSLIYRGFDSFNYIDSLYIGIPNDKIITNDTIGNTFVLKDNQLICKNTSGSIVDSKSFTINGYEDTWSGIYPLHEDEVLVSMGKLK